MIIHISIPATFPKDVATYLAQLVQGECRELSWCPTGYMVFSDDQFSTGIEVLPADTIFMPGQDKGETLVISQNEDAKTSYSCVHFLLIVNLSHDAVMNIASKAGWRAIPKSSLGAVDMIELWVENTLMIEVVLADKKQETIKALNSRYYKGCN